MGSEQILSVRQKMILGILNTKKGLTPGSYLAAQLGVSDRTVRSEIQAMVPVLESYGTEIKSIRGKGYFLHTEQPELLQKLTYREDAIQTPEERIRELVLYLIDIDDPIEVGILEDDLFIGRTTLEGDLRLIEEKYSGEMPYIRLIRSRQTVCFEPDESKKRYLLNTLLTEDWNYNYEAGMHLEGLPVDRSEFLEMEKMLHGFLKENAIRLSEQDKVQFLFSLVIAVSRIRSLHEITSSVSFSPISDPEADDLMPDEHTYAIAEDLAEETGRIAKVSFSEYEIKALSDELAHRVLFNEELLTERYWKQYQKKEISGLIDEALLKEDKMNGLHLGDDQMLKSELLFSILSSCNNPYYSGMRHSEVIRSLKDENPAAAAIAAHFAEKIMAKSDIVIKDNTMMEQAAYIADAMEKAAEKAIPGGIKIALLSHLHISSSRFILAKLRAFFGARIELDGPFSIYEYKWMQGSQYDFVLSTTKLRREEAAPPVLVISPLLTKHDLENINFFLNERRTHALYSGRNCRLSHICIPEYSLVNRKLTAEGDYCEEALNTLIRQGYVRENGRLTKEDYFTTVFSEGFLLAVVQHGDVNEDCVLGIKINKPALLDGVTVHASYVITLRPDSNIFPAEALEHLAHILRRLYQEKSPERKKYEDDLKKLVGLLELF